MCTVSAVQKYGMYIHSSRQVQQCFGNDTLSAELWDLEIPSKKKYYFIITVNLEAGWLSRPGNLTKEHQKDTGAGKEQLTCDCVTSQINCNHLASLARHTRPLTGVVSL